MKKNNFDGKLDKIIIDTIKIQKREPINLNKAEFDETQNVDLNNDIDMQTNNVKNKYGIIVITVLVIVGLIAITVVLFNIKSKDSKKSVDSSDINVLITKSPTDCTTSVVTATVPDETTAKTTDTSVAYSSTDLSTKSESIITSTTTSKTYSKNIKAQTTIKIETHSTASVNNQYTQAHVVSSNNILSSEKVIITSAITQTTTVKPQPFTESLTEETIQPETESISSNKDYDETSKSDDNIIPTDVTCEIE